MSEVGNLVQNTEHNLHRSLKQQANRKSLMSDDVVFNYQKPETSKIESNASLIIGDFLSNRLIVFIFIALVVAYTILVTVRISFDNETSSYAYQLDIVELAFLLLFVFEVFLRILAYKIVRDK